MKHAHTVSWLLFAVLGGAYLGMSLVSVSNAYLNPENDLIAGQYTPADLAHGDPSLAAALSARRGTAAAFGVSYAVLMLAVAFFPYRHKRARWAFAALTVASLLNAGIILLRAPLLQTHIGLLGGTAPLAITVLAAVLGSLASRPAAEA